MKMNISSTGHKLKEKLNESDFIFEGGSDEDDEYSVG